MRFGQWLLEPPLQFIHFGAMGGTRSPVAISGVPVLSNFRKVICCFPLTCTGVLRLEFPALKSLPTRNIERGFWFSWLNILLPKSEF